MSTGQDALAPIVAVALEQTIFLALQTKIVNFVTSLEMWQQLSQNAINDLARVDEETSRDLKTSTSVPVDSGVCRRRCQGVPMVERRRRYCAFWKHFASPFGHLLLSHNARTRSRPESNLGCDFRTSELQITFLPRSRYFRRATSIIITRDSLSKPSLTGLNIQFRPVVACDSPVFKACRCGDINTMKFLFQETDASPHDLDENGEDLLLVSAGW